MKGYKGFSKGLICREKQYAENTVFEEDKAEICKSGMHFCENPFDVLDYYGFVNDKAELNEFAAVEALDEVVTDGKKKYSTHKLKIGAKLNIAGLVKAFVEFTFKKIDFENSAATNTGNYSAATNTGDCSAATNTGDRSAATNTGYYSAATNTGYCSVATSTGNYSAATNTGNCSAATNTGYCSAATNTGYCSAATNTGNYSAATNTGNYSAATNTGNYSAATNTGDCSAATNTGYCSVATNTGNYSAATNTGDCSAATNTGNCSAATVEGNNSVAMCIGYKGKARGSLGCWIVLAEWMGENNGELHISCVKSAKVDNVEIKADTFYKLKNGEFVEVEE